MKNIIRKINRLLPENQKLHKSRSGTGMYQNCGEFYLVDTYTNTVIEMDVDINELLERLRDEQIEKYKQLKKDK